MDSERLCERCGRPFTGGRSDRKKCSDCQTKDRHKARHQETLRCGKCGSEYQGRAIRYPRCPACANVNQVCGICGKSFEARESPRPYCTDCRRNVVTARNDHKGQDFAGVDSEGMPGACDRKGCDCPRYEGDGVGRCTRCGHRKAAFKIPDDKGWDMGHHHLTVLLRCGDYALECEDGIEIGEALAFLYDCSRKYPDETAFVGFSLGYDFAMLFRSLPETRCARMLLPEYQRIRLAAAKEKAAARARIEGKDVKAAERTVRYPYPVDFRDRDTSCEWEIDTLGNKRFKFRPRDRAKWRTGSQTGWMYVCDVFGFFQSSFAKAIDPALYPAGQGPCTPEEYDKILEGKTRRSVARLDDDMRFYNRLEIKALEKLMSLLKESIETLLVVNGKPVVLRKQQWFGPGQIAAAALRLFGAPKRDEIESAIAALRVGEGLLQAAEQSYYGGWFEITVHGPIFEKIGLAGSDLFTIPFRPVWSYDINSAYPYEMSRLPCLLHGKWAYAQTRRKNLPPIKPGQIRLVHAAVHGSDPYIGTMLHRVPMTHGIVRPHHTRGWYWQAELQASKDAGLIDTFEIYEWYTYTPCTCEPPLSQLAEWYEKRANLPKVGEVEGKKTIAGISLKLGFNSEYGKFAQSVGNPEFTNWLWASLITSGCRTMILNAIATHPQKSAAVTMIATDGITFLSPHPALAISSKLGEWEETRHVGQTQVKPGFYYDAKHRQQIRDGKPVSLKSRGISARSVSDKIDDLDKQFTTWKPGDTWPSIKFREEFSIVSCTQALRWGAYNVNREYMAAKDSNPNPNPQRSQWRMAGLVCEGNIRKVSTDPYKKRRVCSQCDYPDQADHEHDSAAVYQENGLWRAGVYEYGHSGLDSISYNGETMSLRAQADTLPAQDFIGIDGDFMSLISEGIGVG